MRYNKHCAGIGAQKILQPFYRSDIEMVGRFVQKQQVRLGKQEPAQPYPCFLPAGKLVHGAVPILFGKAQPFQHTPQAALIAVTVILLKKKL